MAFWDNIRFPYFNMQELNLDWIMRELKRIAGFMPQNGNIGDILTRKSEGAAWEPPEAVNINIDGLPQDTQIMDNDQLIFYDISAQANRKIKPPDLMDSMCSNVTPLMNGTGAAGTSKKPARYDHVHPTDTSRAPASYFQNSALKLTNGGTGADNAADARSNLGLGNVATESVVPIAKGGTGKTNRIDGFESIFCDNGVEYYTGAADDAVYSGLYFIHSSATGFPSGTAWHTCLVLSRGNTGLTPDLAEQIVFTADHMYLRHGAKSGNVFSWTTWKTVVLS